MWGFNISSEKTVAVPFTDGKGEVTLTVNGTLIKCVKETKILGIIFDKRLKWSAHIDYVVTKCKKYMNLMQALSGKR